MKKSKNLFNPFIFRGVHPAKGQHVFATSMLKLRCKKLLRISDYERLLEQDSTEDILKILSDYYGYPLLSVTSFKEDLLADRQNILDFIINSIGNHYYGKRTTSPIQEYLLLPLDFFNLKVLSKGKLEDRSWEKLPLSIPGLFSLDRLELLYQEIPIGFIHPRFKEALSRYSQIPESHKTPYMLDIFWDNEIYRIQKMVLEELGSDIITALHETKLDIKNILSVLRLKKSGKSEEDVRWALQYMGNIRKDILISLFHSEWEGVPDILSAQLYAREVSVGIDVFKETQNFSSLEKHLEEFWLRACRRFISLSNEDDLAIIYNWLKQVEYSNIQTIISGKQNKMQNPWILSHLRIVV